jgi:beta-glucanase (GH16 family)
VLIGLWPYTYDSCDTGTFPNQIGKDGTPATANTGGNGGGKISSLPGQRLSACTCPGSDHPGPSVTTGRGAPEIDIFETQSELSLASNALNIDLVSGSRCQSLPGRGLAKFASSTVQL